MEMANALATPSVTTHPTDKKDHLEQLSEPISTDMNENFADTHPLNTGTVIEKNDFLYLEQEDSVGEIFYDEVPL
jgi:hypothetical protein